MGVNELTRDQLTQLKQSHYCEHNTNVSWGELADIDTLVSDETIKNEYAHTTFVEDDFF